MQRTPMVISKEKKKEYNASYWEANKKRISEKRKADYMKNRDKITERNKKWKKDNREQWNAYLREYRTKRKVDKQKKD